MDTSSLYSLGRLDYKQKSRLTTMLVGQRNQGVKCPTVTAELIRSSKTKRPLPIHERAENLLCYVANLSEHLAVQVSLDPIDEMEQYFRALAWSDSIEFFEIDFLVEYLCRNEWIERSSNDLKALTVTVEG